MGGSDGTSRPASVVQSPRLAGGKPIAEFLDCSVRQTLRYKRDSKLPVRTFGTGRLQVADPDALAIWLQRGTPAQVIFCGNVLTAYAARVRRVLEFRHGHTVSPHHPLCGDSPDSVGLVQ